MTTLGPLESDDERGRRQLEVLHVRIDQLVKRRRRELKAEISRLWQAFSDGGPGPD